MLKKFLIGTFVVAAFAIMTTVASAYDFGTTTLKVGSKGAAVGAVQTLVGATVDNSFGPMTKAKVQAWQAANGLVADGIFGNMSKAKANGAVSGNFPAGCTSASGFSPTTGQACVAIPSTVAGCQSGALFSSTTGQSCTSTTPVVTGGAGDIQTVEVLSSVSGAKVGEGATDHKVFAYTVEADNGSDLSINSVKLNLQRTAGTGSTKLNRYASNVSVWMGSTKVGSALVSSFSEASNVYSKSIALSGAVIKADQKATFYVTVDSLVNIDSTDLASNTWTVTLESTRFSDGTGAILTDSTASISKTFQFASLATANDVELKVNLSSTNPTAKTVKVSTTSDTAQVELLKFTMKAQGSSMLIDQIPVLFTTSETDLDEVTSNVTLKIAGNTYNETVVTSTAATATILFDNLNLSVAADATIEGIVYADVNDIESGTFDEGITLSAEITSALVAAVSGNYIDVEDMNGDALATGDRTGSAIGEAMTFRSTGVNTVMGTPTYGSTTDTNGLVTSVTYTIPVAVTSFGNTLYIGQSAQLATAASASNAFALVAETAALPTTESVSATTSITLSTTDATIESNGFRLDDGVTKHFTVNVTMTAATDNTSIRFRLDTIRTFTEAGLVTATNSDLLPTTNYRTDFKYINN
ncbi:peptidoglycan-binding protein [Candidatus Dojkabacteria bacterium]|jgi:peptidoglycan hydrolase-like protein with peptidoglycan-binding domain|nr:peptidoglycan-binding protein [Candidatus Dojkabacteria bacterium]